ncbi:GEVED domain-containing protein [Micromonospora sp. NPDC049559]|uniref:GEVED domain-containing protein n=1 Tax=Micromonospora sp. NPDC049559 TaxID=3155923 RepID=UPI0034343567
MTRRTGSVTFLSVPLLFAAVLLPAWPSPAAGATLGHTHGWDYGDAPLRYRTLRAQGGPRHLVAARSGALTLGTTVTADPDGRPDDGDADDGLVTPVRLTAGTPRVTVTVRNNTRATALLAGWLDTSGDGFGARERAVVRVPVGATRATLRWKMPAGTGTRAGQLRLRLYHGLPLHPVPVGAAVGGEVEDYRVTFVAAPTTPAPPPPSAAPVPTPTKAAPRPAPARSARTSTNPAGPTPSPTRSDPSTSAPAPAPSQPSRASSAPARPATHAEPARPRRGGLPLTWSIALLIVVPAAAGAAHAVGRAARRRH